MIVGGGKLFFGENGGLMLMLIVIVGKEFNMGFDKNVELV